MVKSKDNTKIISTLDDSVEPIKVILLARAGAGKTSSIDEAKKILIQKGISAWDLITATTRDPREGETHLLDYMFCTEEEFETYDFVSSISPGGWVKYGVPYAENIREGVGFFSPISLQYATDTAEAFQERDPSTKVIFIILDIPRDVRAERMRSRGESEESIIKRFAIEDEEGSYDLSKLPKDTIIISDAMLSIDEVRQKLVSIIQDACTPLMMKENDHSINTP